jgi:microcystin degradation protein MlrC
MAVRVLSVVLKHETNTFCAQTTDVEAFTARYFYEGADVARYMASARVEMAAFFDAASKFGWTLVHPFAASATPGGPVTKNAFDLFSGRIMSALRTGPPVDAVLLSLHGAMVLEHDPDGDGLLLQMIRHQVGKSVPIMATIDLHANVSDRMAACAQALVSCRKYPHTDQYETGMFAANLLHRTLKEEIRPRTFVARGNMLDAVDHGRTSSPGPMLEALSCADRLSAEPGVHAISVNAGFPWADIYDAGPTAVVVGSDDGQNDKYRQIASRLIDEIWRTRHRTTISSVGVAEAMRLLKGPNVRGASFGPVIVADFADNPGGGGYGDSTTLLGAMIEADIENAAFATIYDPEAVGVCKLAGIGSFVETSLGGKVDPNFGAPMLVRGRVQALTDGVFECDGPMMQGMRISLGPTAVLRVSGVDIVVASARNQAFDPQFFKHAGIDPEKKTVLAVKSAHHFRAAYEAIAQGVLIVDDGGGLTSRNFKKLHYKNVRRPIFPLDLD